MGKIIIGKLDSIDEIFELVKEHFVTKRRELRKSNEVFELIFDDFNLGLINISSLNMLLCLLYSIRKHYNYPFSATFYSHINNSLFFDDRVSAFLKSIKFIELSSLLRLINWNIYRIIPDLNYNPNTIILHVDVAEISINVNKYFPNDKAYDESFYLLNHLHIKFPKHSKKEINYMYEEIKSLIKNDIKDYIRDNIDNIFKGSNHGRYLKINIISYVSEIILNSFLHGRTKPFIALQRTDKIISISICDDGVGLKTSYERLHNIEIEEKEAIKKACKHREYNSYGLYDIVYSVLGYNNPSFVMSNAHHGFFTISSGSSILKLSRNNFEKFLSGKIQPREFDSKINIRGVRVSMDLLIK